MGILCIFPYKISPYSMKQIKYSAQKRVECFSFGREEQNYFLLSFPQRESPNLFPFPFIT